MKEGAAAPFFMTPRPAAAFFRLRASRAVALVIILQ
jgi:hypothetical protein